MKYRNEEWTIQKLIEVYEKGIIDLSPPYQRNPIWTLKAQKLLIETIKNNQPIPNFFILGKDSNKLEMVDGQQRARAILGYWKQQIPDNAGKVYNNESSYLNYILNVTVISDLNEEESIEKFYALVNSSGLRLNRPEVMKARHFDSNFLRLAQELADMEKFRELKLFTTSSINRMNDVEFVTELIALLKFGISEKKDKVDELYKNDITAEDYQSLLNQFKSLINIFWKLNSIKPISDTRYRQKNDFYTFFHFFNKHNELIEADIEYFYKVMVKIGLGIRPTQENCEPLQEYAVHCVTQSNSRKAREARLMFFENLLLNSNNQPNPTQAAVLNFLKMSVEDMEQTSIYFTLDISKIDEVNLSL